MCTIPLKTNNYVIVFSEEYEYAENKNYNI